MIFLVLCSIIAVACGRLTSTVTTTELARKSEKNETKSFSLQAGGNNCIVPKWKDKNSIWTENFNSIGYKIWIDTRGNAMAVNLGEGNIETGQFTSRYIGFINCDGSFTYDCPSNFNDCSVYVPIIYGSICNSETRERYSGKIDFTHRDVCPSVGNLLDIKKHGNCYYSIQLCF